MENNQIKNSAWNQTNFSSLPDNEVMGRSEHWKYETDTTKVSLHYQVLTKLDVCVETTYTGKQFDVVVLHGLFANGSHFKSFAENLLKTNQNVNRVILVDLRNHGDSDFHDSMTFSEMSEDVQRVITKLQIKKFILMGHSIGAKVGMVYSMTHSEMLEGLIILDTYPKDYRNFPDIYKNTLELIENLIQINLDNFNNKYELLTVLNEKFVKINFLY
jgi:pimeloyl-ACP methyl ester carboxylesterase